MQATTTAGPCASSRGPARYQEIRHAVLDELTDSGYENLTIDAVAARARASKATIYRNWEGKADLVADALANWPGMELKTPDTGSLREDLLAMCRMLHEKVNSPQSTLFVGLLRTIQTDPALAESLRARTHSHAQSAYRTVIGNAIERGEISGCQDPELVFSIAPALMFFRALFTGDPVDERLLVEIVDGILLPTLTRQTR